jgi:Endonuclease/Exonuclease/phosphatase family
LNRAAEGELVADLSTPDDFQAAAVAEVVQRIRPDIVLLNEFDYVEGGAAVELFRDDYLASSQHGAEPIDFPYYFIAPSNTGVESGFDLNNDGTVGGADHAFGFGKFPGQYRTVVLSRFPILTEQVRTFQNVLWASMPDARLPDDPATAEPGDWYSAEELGVVRLSSKSHGTCRSTSTTGCSTCSPPTRPRRCSTVPRTATAPATPTRFVSGPICRRWRSKLDRR